MDNYWRYYGRSMISFCFFLLCGVTESDAPSLFPLIYLNRCEINYNNSLLRQKIQQRKEQFHLKIYHVKNKLSVFFF